VKFDSHRSAAVTPDPGFPGLRVAALPAALAGMLAIGALTGCVPPSLMTLRGDIDSLRTVVDTLAVRDSIAFVTLLDLQREVLAQREVLLSSRATTGTTNQQLLEQLNRQESQISEVMSRFQQSSQRAQAPPSGPDPNQLYDQAALDLTQGRYSMALQGFREFVRKNPTTELADNAQYGVGECLFAQSQFDSAAVEYARVESQWPKGDKVPAALYKLALCQDKLNKAEDSKRTLEDLVKRFPLSGEAQLARERLSSGGRH
jgi:tol-pal system protein YbgF